MKKRTNTEREEQLERIREARELIERERRRLQEERQAAAQAKTD